MEQATYLLEQALALTSEWVSVSDLPGDTNSGSRCTEYDTLVYFGLAERKSETVYASGLPCGVKVFYRMSSNNVSVTAELLIKKFKEECDLRYQEESTTRENPLRVGTKRIKINGVEYPFIAVSDHWRPALLHDNRMVWIHHYRAVEGLRRGIFKVYYATVKVPYNRLPWTMDNQVINTGGRYNDGKFETLIEALNVALLIAQEKEVELERSNAASLLGRRGGLVKSERKAEKVRENGKKGGRKSRVDIFSLGEDEE